MEEATHSVQQAPATSHAQRQAMGRAVMVAAPQRAIKEAKRQLAARGLKLANYSHREIVAMAEEADAQRRAKIIAEAKAIVTVWEAEGYFRSRRRAARSVRKDRELRTLAEQEERRCGGNGQ